MVPNSSMRKFCLHDEMGIYGFSQVYHGKLVSDLNLFHCVSDLAAAFVQCVENPLTRGKVHMSGLTQWHRKQRGDSGGTEGMTLLKQSL